MQDNHGKTPLHWSIENEDSGVLQVLLAPYAAMTRYARNI